VSVATQRYVAVRLMRLAAAAAAYILANILLVPLANAPHDIAVWASGVGLIVALAAMAGIAVTARFDRHYTRFLDFLDNGF
jgi:O-antigen/teichoic acid export membrane protein